MRDRVFLGILLGGLVAFAPGSASAVTGVLCVKATGKGAVKARAICKTSEVQVGSFDTNTPQANLTDVSVQVRLAADVAIPNVVSTAVPFGPGSESFDTHNMHDEVVNPTRLTAPVAGKYFVYGTLLWEDAAGGTTRQAAVLVNGAAHVVSALPPSSSEVVAGTVVTQVELAAGGYVELYATQDSGGSIDLFFPYTEFGMVKVP